MAERQGVPAIGVMTTRFASAAELMCRVLGMPDSATPALRARSHLELTRDAATN